MKRTRKVVSTLVAVALVGGIVLPAATPALAYSKNSVSKVISIDNNDEPQLIGSITIREDSEDVNDFAYGDVFTLTLPSGVEWVNKANIDGNPGDETDLIKVKVNNTVYVLGQKDSKGYEVAKLLSDSRLQITMPQDDIDNGSKVYDEIIITPYIKADSSVNGDIKVKIDGKDSAVTSQELLIARAFDGDTITTVEDIETIGDATSKAGEITIEESARGSMGNDFQKIKIKLPSDFDWKANTDFKVTFSGSFSNSPIEAADVMSDTNISNKTGQGYVIDGRNLTIYFTPNRNTTNQRGIITIVPVIDPGKNAKYGEVEVNVSGDNVSTADVVIAKYADFGVELKVKEVEELFAGRFDEETEEITIEESVAGTFIPGRKITLELPSWVKVTDVKFTQDDFGIKDNFSVYEDIDDNEVEFEVVNTTKGNSSGGKLKFKLQLSIEGNKAGDITMKVTGKAGGEGELVIAKAVAPVKIEGQATNVKVGVKKQAIGDIVITELKDGAIAETNEYTKSNKTELYVDLTDGVKWNDYKVEVIEGNLDIDEDAIDTDKDDTRLVIPIKGESSKPSKIKISGITVDLDRTIPEGVIEAKVKGDAVIQNDKAQDGWLAGKIEEDASGKKPGSDRTLDSGEFDTSTAAKAVVANVVTPAPEAGTALFSIGSTVYTAGGVTKVMDAAPYIKDGRTYVPVRYLALALGVAENDIQFENGVVTLTKDNNVIKLTIGSTTLLKNDESITMDVAPEVVDGRTMLPARFVAEALGAQVGYANGQVVISY